MKKSICALVLGCLATNSALAEITTTAKDPVYGNFVNEIMGDDYKVFLSGGETLAIGDKITEPMSASQLIALYEKNELAANKKLKGKLVRIKSSASEIGENAVGQAYINVDGKNQFQNITLYVDGNDERILALEKGQKIDFTCRMDKYIIRTPLLKNCVFTTDLAKQRKDSILKSLSEDKLSFGLQAFFQATYDLNKEEFAKTCVKSGTACLSSIGKVLANAKKVETIRAKVKELTKDKQLPLLPY